MDWTTLVATLVGAAIATATSLLTEARKDRRHLAAESRRTHRDLYVAFLNALAHARNDLLARSKDRAGPGVPDERLRQAFAPCYEVRHQLELLAPEPVVTPALTYFRSVRDVRNHLADGGLPTGATWDDLLRRIKDTLQDAHAAMRADLAKP